MFDKKKNIMILVATAISFALVLPMQAFGFAEDICYFYKNPNNRTDVLPIAVNCFDLECMDGVAGGSQSAAKCTTKGLAKYAIATGVYGLTTQETKIHGRNSLHFDMTWLAGRLMGLTSSDALDLAVFSQGADLGVYKHIDKNGKVMPNAVSDDLSGILRTNFKTPGLWLHFVPRYMGTSSSLTPSALSYNKNNTKKPYDSTERPLDQVRQWAFGWHQKPCIFGLANSEGICLSRTRTLTSFLDPFIMVTGEPVSFRLGAQGVIPRANGTYIDGSQYQGTVKALGVYLHMMGDRISHTQCSAPTGIKKEVNGNFTLVYAKSCGQAVHVGLHYRETAHAPVPARTKRGVELVLREIKAWIKEKGNYQKDPTSPATVNVTAIVERTATALSESCASKRLEALCNISKSYGLGWHDGNTNCVFDHDFCNEQTHTDKTKTGRKSLKAETGDIRIAGVGCNQVRSSTTPSLFWLSGLFCLFGFGFVRRRLKNS